MHVQRIKHYTSREQNLDNNEVMKSQSLTTKDNDLKILENKAEKQSIKTETLNEIKEDQIQPKDISLEIDELTANDTPDSIVKIINHSDTGGVVKYQVQWESKEETWVEESDMNCPELLVGYTKTLRKRKRPPHELLESLIAALEGVVKEIQNPKCKLTNVGIKKKIKEYIGRGNPYLKSSRVVTRLEGELQQESTKEQFILLLNRWISDSNETFTGEWDHT